MFSFILIPANAQIHIRKTYWESDSDSKGNVWTDGWHIEAYVAGKAIIEDNIPIPGYI